MGRSKLALAWVLGTEVTCTNTTTFNSTNFTGTAKATLPQHGKDGWNCYLKGNVIDTCTLAKPDVPLNAIVAGEPIGS